MWAGSTVGMVGAYSIACDCTSVLQRAGFDMSTVPHLFTSVEISQSQPPIYARCDHLALHRAFIW